MKSHPRGIFGVILAAAICVTAIIAWFAYHKMMTCETHEVVLDRSNSSYSVIKIDTACDGIASSYDVSLELIGKSGQRLRFFEYGDGTSFVRNGDDSKPLVKWLDDQTLQVKIGTVAYIHSAVGYAENITIRYSIGRIMFRPKVGESK